MAKDVKKQLLLNKAREFFYQKNFIGAATVAQKITAISPQDPLGWSILGSALAAQGNTAIALSPLRKAVNLSSDDPVAHNNLGNALKSLCYTEEAIASYVKAIKINPNYAIAHNNLGNAYKLLGSFDKAESFYTQAIKLAPNFIQAHSNRLMLVGSFLFDESKQRQYLEEYNSTLRSTTSFRFQHTKIDSRKLLRLGFVSGDFTLHPVGLFLEAFLVALKNYDVEIFAYSNHNHRTETAKRLSSLFNKFTTISELSDESAARLIHSHKVDILFDLSGHTAKNRLPLFAYKPAPIQISWLGYFASTGVNEIDYILGDRVVTPYAQSKHFTEKIIQLDSSYLCFTPPRDSLLISDSPFISNRYITFGCFNNLSRMTREVIEIRARILHSVPGSKLYLKCRQLDHSNERERIIREFTELGIKPNRLILEGFTPRQEYLASYNRVDIILSPFPYGGGTTICEGLWMGVPALVKSGDYFLSRIGESLMRNSGLTDWVAIDNNDYVNKAVGYASEPSRLVNLRKEMRELLRKSPLFNTDKFIDNFVSTLYSIGD